MFIVNSNIWIAIATVSFYELSLIQIDELFHLNSTVIFLFFSTLFIYNFFRILVAKEDCKTWYSKNYSFTRTLTILSFLACVFLFFYIDKKFIVIYLISGILSLFYAFPLFKFGEKKIQLRKVWFLKSIIVALVWTLTTSALPLLENKIPLSNIYLFSLEKFLFILGISITYDIKDLKQDLSVGVKTFALKYGIRNTILISNFVLLLGLLLGVFLYPSFALPISISYIFAMVLNYNIEETKGEYWYTLFIDGSIIFYFIISFIYILISH